MPQADKAGWGLGDLRARTHYSTHWTAHASKLPSDLHWGCERSHTADFAIRPALSFTTNQGLIPRQTRAVGSGGRWTCLVIASGKPKYRGHRQNKDVKRKSAWR